MPELRVMAFLVLLSRTGSKDNMNVANSSSNDSLTNVSKVIHGCCLDNSLPVCLQIIWYQIWLCSILDMLWLLFMSTVWKSGHMWTSGKERWERNQAFVRQMNLCLWLCIGSSPALRLKFQIQLRMIFALKTTVLSVAVLSFAVSELTEVYKLGCWKTLWVLGF